MIKYTEILCSTSFSTPVRGSRVLLVHWRRSQQGLKRNGLNSKYGVKDGKISKIGFVHHQQETSSFQTS